MTPSSCPCWKGTAVLIRIAVGILFVVAGILKAADPFQFLVDILNFQIVAYPVAVATALFLPWLEIFSGLALGLRRWRGGALAILLILLIVFSVVVVAARARGVVAPCGCFGASWSASSPAMVLLRNAFLLAVVGLLLRQEARGTVA